MSHTDGNSKQLNTSHWTQEEDQVLVDGLLIGNLLLLWDRLEKDFGRTADDAESRIQDLMKSPKKWAFLPECWCSSREAAYELVRNRKHEGEPELSDDEWKNLVLWIHNDYVGIDPTIFHWTRSTERLRQEVRIFDAMDLSVFDRVAKIFAAEKDSNPSRKSRRGFRWNPIGKPSLEVKERRDKKNAEAKERRDKKIAEEKEAKSKQKKDGQSKSGRQPRTDNAVAGKREKGSSDKGNDERVKEGTYE